MLIKRNVFEKIRCGILENLPGDFQSSDDIYFSLKAEEAGFDIYCNTNIKCEHLIGGKFVKKGCKEFVHPAYDNN